MALDSEVRSKIVRQELDAALVGPAFTRYEARVKYNPENIEKETFFSLCYGMLKVGDEIVLHTYKKDRFNCYYQFLVIDVDKEAKIVKTLLLKKYDFNHPEANVEVEGIDTEALNKAVAVMVNTKLEDIVKTLNELQSNFNKYTTDTDDQLEEIEDAIDELKGAPISGVPAPDGSVVDIETEDDVETEDEDSDEADEE